MATFAGTNLTALGTIDLDGAYTPPDRAVQTFETSAPGVAGSLLLIGGERPQTIIVPIEVIGSGASKSAAITARVANSNTIGGLLGTTGDLVDDHEVTYTNVTLVGVRKPRGPRYWMQGTTQYVSTLEVMVFRRTFYTSA